MIACVVTRVPNFSPNPIPNLEDVDKDADISNVWTVKWQK